MTDEARESFLRSAIEELNSSPPGHVVAWAPGWVKLFFAQGRPMTESEQLAYTEQHGYPPPSTKTTREQIADFCKAHELRHTFQPDGGVLLWREARG